MNNSPRYTSNCLNSKYYAPGQFCNNFKSIKENHYIFKRNFPSSNLDITFSPRPLPNRCCTYNDKDLNKLHLLVIIFVIKKK